MVMLDPAADLNAEQHAAVIHTQGPSLVLAGAGSGKTRVITYKIAYLVESCGVLPWEILAVTFTNKAAREMRDRTEALMGARAKDVWLGTFHSIGLRVLRRHADLVGRTQGFVIYDQDDRERLIRKVLKKLNVPKDQVSARQVSYFIDDQRHVLRGPNHPELPDESWQDRICVKAYKGYEEAKKRANAFDFSDLIFRMVTLMENYPQVLSEWQFKWRYILVDEFQDTDKAQYKLLKMLAGDQANICVVGDDDQSIYRWRGAHVANILGFDRDFPDHTVDVVRLERNYRSTANILKAASALIAQNTERHDKTLWTESPAGEPLRCYQAESEVGEAHWVVRHALEARTSGVPLSEIAVFYRTHSQSRVFEDALRSKAIPYKVVGGLKFYERKEVKDILTYMRLVHNPADDIALLRVINSPTRGIGAKTMERAAILANAEDKTLYDGMALLARSPEGSRARKSIERFLELMTTLRNIAADGDAFRVAEAVLAETGYISRLKEEGTIEAESRRENVEELLLSIQEWRTRTPDRGLTAFLDHVSLLTSLDEGDEVPDALTLMSIHAAKGLEFDTVFVTGLEEDVFPHFNSKEPEAMEEERRLAYVAITRGKKRVFLSWARSRRRFGRMDMNPVSRFVQEIPKDVLSFDSEMGRRQDPFGSKYAGGRGSNRDPFAGGAAKPQAGSSSGGWAGGSKSAAGWNKSSAPPRKPKPIEATGPTLDYSDSQLEDSGEGASGFLGQRVAHPRFGRGKVVAIDGNGTDAKVTVRFPAFGEKKIIARFLELVD
ncbi:MAG: DNA helicase-2/ATP-dependent DNA helicase PcrA [Myxococcota bacterium]|jgi:DNA helicase-2/ATP-dependent DNA helicase PcrA